MAELADGRLEDLRRRRQLAESPLLEHLAVLAEFRPDDVPDPDTADVVRYFCTGAPQGTPLSVLSPRPRIEALTTMLARAGTAALTATRADTEPHVDTPLQRMLDVFTTQRSADRQLDENELLAALRVWRWATEAVARARSSGSDRVRIPFDRDEIEGQLARLEITRAVRRLADRGCIGREAELQRLHDYIDDESKHNLLGDPPMVMYGIGGVGKSTVIARFVADLVDGRHDGFSGAWAYLDLDRPTLRNYQTDAILDEVLRQVAAQLPTGRRQLTRTRRANKAQTRGAGLESFDAPTPQAAEAELGSLLSTLSDGRLVVVLDTFEEVTLAAPAQPRQIYDLFTRLSDVLDSLKLIVVGRAPVEPFARHADRLLHVRNFTGAEAVRLLRHFLTAMDSSAQVDDALARQVVETVSGNPLTLQLAARVLATEGQRGFDDAARGVAVDRVRREFVSGFLYRRILEHIEASDAAATDQLRAVAKASLVLRRVTVALLADVLLPAIGHPGADAEWFYAELAREVAFVERLPVHLRLREELRGPALLALGYEDQTLVDRIHRAATEHYRALLADDPDAGDELAYHELALGTPLADLQVDQATIRRVAGSLLSLPAGVTAELHALDQDSSADLSPERDQLEWERRVWSEADLALRSDRLDEARGLLDQRTARRPTTELHRIESRLAEAEGDLRAALASSWQDLAASRLAGDRTRYAAAAVRTAELGERLGLGTAADTLRHAAADTLLAGDHGLRLELHLDRLATLERTGRLDEDQRWTLELDARVLLARLDPAAVDGNDALLKLLAATLGRDQPALLRVGASRVGLGPDEDPARLRRLAAAVDVWDHDQVEPGRLARAVGIGDTGPVGPATWVSALAGLGAEAGHRLDTLWEVEQPPFAVREALRTFYLWWGIPSRTSGGEPGFLDVYDAMGDYTRPEAQQLHQIVLAGYGHPESLLGLADRAGIDPAAVDLTGSPDAMVRKFLLRASAEGRLRGVVEAILADPDAGTLADVLRDLIVRAGSE